MSISFAVYLPQRILISLFFVFIKYPWNIIIFHRVLTILPVLVLLTEYSIHTCQFSRLEKHFVSPRDIVAFSPLCWFGLCSGRTLVFSLDTADSKISSVLPGKTLTLKVCCDHPKMDCAESVRTLEIFLRSGILSSQRKAVEQVPQETTSASQNAPSTKIPKIPRAIGSPRSEQPCWPLPESGPLHSHGSDENQQNKPSQAAPSRSWEASAGAFESPRKAPPIPKGVPPATSGYISSRVRVSESAAKNERIGNRIRNSIKEPSSKIKKTLTHVAANIAPVQMLQCVSGQVKEGQEETRQVPDTKVRGSLERAQHITGSNEVIHLAHSGKSTSIQRHSILSWFIQNKKTPINCKRMLAI